MTHIFAAKKEKHKKKISFAHVIVQTNAALATISIPTLITVNACPQTSAVQVKITVKIPFIVHTYVTKIVNAAMVISGQITSIALNLIGA